MNVNAFLFALFWRAHGRDMGVVFPGRVGLDNRSGTARRVVRAFGERGEAV